MTDNRGTDKRPPFFSIEDAVVEDYHLTPLAGWLYVVIAKHINRKTGEAFPSLNKLAKIAGMSRTSVIRNIKLLEDKNLIEVTRECIPGKKESEVNHYKLLSATKVVSDRHHVVSDVDNGSITQTPQVVSDVHRNHKNLNHKNLTKEKKNSAPEKSAAVVELKTMIPESSSTEIQPPSRKKTGEVVASIGVGGVQDVKTPQPPNAGAPPSPTHQEKSSMIAAWWNALPAKPADLTYEKIFKRKGWFEYATSLWIMGLRPHHVTRFVEMQTGENGFYRDKGITWQQVAQKLPPFARANRMIERMPTPQPEQLPVAAGNENIRDYSVEGNAILEALFR